MMRYFLFVILCIICLSAVVISGQDDCRAQSTLLVGHLARVTPGEPNNVRFMPGADAMLVGKLAGEEQFMVTEGPICADGFVWWGVDSVEQDMIGYTVEGADGTNWVELVPHEMDYNLYNFSFDFTPVADNVSVSIVPEDLESFYFRGPSPSHLFVELENPLLYEQYPSQIRMYPVDYFEFIHPQDYERIQNYWRRLQNEPDNVEQAMFLLQVGAGVLHSSHYARVEFEGGYGIRYIVQFAQNIAPLSGHDMVYTFQGVSNDGNYYISAVLPITIPSTLAYNEEIGDFYDHSHDEQLQINDHLRELITETQGHEFFPTIDSLDGVIQSIRLDGFGQMPPVVAWGVRYSLEDVQFDASAITDELGGYVEGQDQGSSWLHFRLVESLWSPITADNHLFVINVKPIERILQYEDGIFANQVWRVQQALRDKPEIPETVEGNLNRTSYNRLDNVRYIQTEHLDGVRFLYQSGPGPVRYIFSGISTDGRYLIEASLPVTETEDGIITPCIEGLDVIFETMTFDGSIIESDFECGASD